MTIKQLASVAALVLTFATSACAPVFHAGDYAGLTPVAPVEAAAPAPVVAQR